MTTLHEIRLLADVAVLEPTGFNAVKMLDGFDACEVEAPVCAACGEPVEMQDEHFGKCTVCGTMNGDKLTPGFLTAIF